MNDQDAKWIAGTHTPDGDLYYCATMEDDQWNVVVFSTPDLKSACLLQTRETANEWAEWLEKDGRGPGFIARVTTGVAAGTAQSPASAGATATGGDPPQPGA